MKNVIRSGIAMGIAVALTASVIPGFGITNDLDSLGRVSWSFESSGDGDDIVNTDSWYGDAGSLTAFPTNYTKPAGGHPLSATGHTAVAKLSASVTNAITGGEYKSIWLDHIVKPQRWELKGHPTDIPADAQMAYYVNTNGHMVIYHAGIKESSGGNGVDATGTNIWTEVSSIDIAADQWIRVSINMAYDRFAWSGYYFRIMIDGTMVTSEQAVVYPSFYDDEPDDPKDYTLGGAYFMVGTEDGAGKMNAISLNGIGYLDDFVVSTNPPHISYIIASSITPSDGHGGTTDLLGDVPVEEGSNQAFTVTSTNYWLIEKVVVSHNGVTTTNMSPASPFSTNLVNVTQHGSIAAYFIADTTNGVPTWWMAHHDIEGQEPSQAVTDSWIASQDPRSNTEFKITRTWQANGTNYVEWICTGIDPDLPPIDIQKSSGLANGFSIVDSKAREEGTNTWSEAAPASATFYRVSATNAL